MENRSIIAQIMWRWVRYGVEKEFDKKLRRFDGVGAKHEGLVKLKVESLKEYEIQLWMQRFSEL